MYEMFICDLCHGGCLLNLSSGGSCDTPSMTWLDKKCRVASVVDGNQESFSLTGAEL